MSIVCITFSASERDSDMAGDWRERLGSKVLEIWPVPSVKVKSFAKSNRFKAIFTVQTEAKDKSQVG